MSLAYSSVGTSRGDSLSVHAPNDEKPPFVGENGLLNAGGGPDLYGDGGIATARRPGVSEVVTLNGCCLPLSVDCRPGAVDGRPDLRSKRGGGVYIVLELVVDVEIFRVRGNGGNASGKKVTDRSLLDVPLELEGLRGVGSGGGLPSTLGVTAGTALAVAGVTAFPIRD
jgi:hypothetical protein